MPSKQFDFSYHASTRALKSHGGEAAQGKRKTRRPFDPKQALHVVLRSSRARGRHSLLHPAHCNLIRDKLLEVKSRWGVRVYRFANVGNHLHLLVRARNRTAWQGFIREFSGSVAMIVTGARKGYGLRGLESRRPADSNSSPGFWDHLVFSRIVRFGRDFDGVARYVLTNLWEGAGVPLRSFLKRGFRVLEVSETGGVWIQEGLP